jgi:NAD(P)-dependent dehydrogenase (short-subunit alcohol dehydrogenase family)
MAKIWLITGSGNGLGRDLAEAALAAGDNVVAGARRTEELAPLVAQYGERVKPVTLEVRDEAAAKSAVRLAVESFGRLDVLVNNAGYGQIAPFEQMSGEDFQAVMDTCFYGVVYTTRAAIPVMRRQKSGCIFQVSSVGGRLAVAGNTPYHAAKWAVGGFSDALAMEVAPFGVKICSLEPGGIRTNWARRARQKAPELLPEYEASVGANLKVLQNPRGSFRGRPAQDCRRGGATGKQRRCPGPPDPGRRCGKEGAAGGGRPSGRSRKVASSNCFNGVRRCQAHSWPLNH